MLAILRFSPLLSHSCCTQDIPKQRGSSVSQPSYSSSWCCSCGQDGFAGRVRYSVRLSTSPWRLSPAVHWLLLSCYPASSWPAVPRGSSSFEKATSSHYLLNVVFQQFNGLQVAGSRWFPTTLGIYPDTAAYVGMIALVLALTAVVVRRRNPAVLALGAVVLVTGLLVFATSLVSFTYGWSLVSGVGWHYALLPMAFAIALLAGVGMDAVVESWRSGFVLQWVRAGFAAAAVFLVALWIFGRGHLPGAEAAIRNKSFIWPTVDVVVGLIVVGGLLAVRRADPPWARGRLKVGVLAGIALLVCETGFLIGAGSPLISSSSNYLAATQAESSLRATVGNTLVGYGAPLQCIHPAQLGILPNVNIVYGIHEFGVYDPIVPRAYYESWGEQSSGTLGGLWWWYCPQITTVAQAQLYGVSFVLEKAGSTGPPGVVFDKNVGNEALFRIPDSSPATLSPLGGHGALPPAAVLHGGCGPSPQPGDVEAPGRCRYSYGPATPAHRRPRLACHHRRKTPCPCSVLQGNDPGSHPRRDAHGRADLLALLLHDGHRPRSSVPRDWSSPLSWPGTRKPDRKRRHRSLL